MFGSLVALNFHNVWATIRQRLLVFPELAILQKTKPNPDIILQADVEEMEVEQPAPANAEDKGKGKAAPTKRFEIKKWNAVAMWSWAICTDTCAICRNNLYEPSIEYQVCSCLIGLLSLHHLTQMIKMIMIKVTLSPSRQQCWPGTVHEMTFVHAGQSHRGSGPSRPKHCLGYLRPCLPP